jgi:hypothetical protein
MCLSGVKYLHVNCCFNENHAKHVGLVQIVHQHRDIRLIGK